ncbi:histidine kinase [Oleisolibacter albus]|uniref:histidine kinase n=1 Tax=Oleisolibacter albus TaxID=2171757 RepID=UPI000DF4038A|nr:histidine kinase [Oleisolibacter albus]
MSISASWLSGPVRQGRSRREHVARRLGMSFRVRVILCLSGFGLLVWTLMAVGLLVNARTAVEREVTASFGLARHYLQSREREMDRATPAGLPFSPTALPPDMVPPRHVRIYAVGPGGETVPVQPPLIPAGTGDEAVPLWFASLIDVPTLRAEFPVMVQDRPPDRSWTLVLESHAHDEILEVWGDVRFVLLLLALSSALVVGSAVIGLNSIFSPLLMVAEKMRHLGTGRPDVRIGRLAVPELAYIADRFNELAERLADQEAENRDLNRRLLVTQDTERRRIANDLHDELGPHLFGLRTVIESLSRSLQDGKGPDRGGLRDGLGTLAEMTQAVQQQTRRIISTLQPMSLGEVPVAELVEDIVATMQRITPDARIELQATTGPVPYGALIDLTVHRFVQESVLNALRHGQARHIVIILAQERGGRGETLVRARVTDDGAAGIALPVKPGYGLSGLSERLRALRGEWTPPTRIGDRTMTEIVLPVDGNRISEQRGL